MKEQGYTLGSIISAFADQSTTSFSTQETGVSGSQQEYFAQIIGGDGGEDEIIYGYLSKRPEGIEIEWLKAPEFKDGKAIDLRIVMNDGFGEELELKELF